MTIPPQDREEETGVALLAVILGLIVVSVLALGLILTTGASVEESHSNLQSSEARAFANAVILQTSILLMDTANPNRPRVDGSPQLILVLGQKVPVTVISEFGKIDLNAADGVTLTLLLEAAGEGPATATAEADQILNWRAASRGTTEVRPFRSISELTQLSGITRDLYSTIEPAITVYSGRGEVDESTAPLLALEGSAGMDRQTAETFVRTRDSNENNDTFGEIMNGQLQPGVSLINWAFTIDSDFWTDKRSEHITVVIRMTGDLWKPYLTLYRDQIPE